MVNWPLTWCQNVLNVKCDDTELGRTTLQQFINENTRDDGTLSFHKQVPTPICSNYREFYWGCSADVVQTSQLKTTDTSTELEINFDTINSPCDQWLIAVIDIYKELSFVLTYSEFEADYSGIMEGSDGEVTRNDCDEYVAFSPMCKVDCPECGDECNYVFNDEHDTMRLECAHHMSHICEYGHCQECSKEIFCRFWSKHRIAKFMNHNIDHRLYRYPDGLRVPSIKKHFESAIYDSEI